MTRTRHTRRGVLALAGIAGAGLLLLAGCADTSTDPHEGGLAGGIKGLVTGEYEKRAEDKRAELGDLERAEGALRSRVGDAKARLVELDRRLANRRKVLTSLHADIAAIDRLIAAAKAKRAPGGQAKLDGMISERNQLSNMVRDIDTRNREETVLHQKAKKLPGADGLPGGGEPDVAVVADIERRAAETDKKAGEAGARIGKLKTALDKSGT